MGIGTQYIETRSTCARIVRAQRIRTASYNRANAASCSERIERNVLEKNSNPVNYELDEQYEGSCNMAGVDLTNVAEKELKDVTSRDGDSCFLRNSFCVISTGYAPSRCVQSAITARLRYTPAQSSAGVDRGEP